MTGDLTNDKILKKLIRKARLLSLNDYAYRNGLISEEYKNHAILQINLKYPDINIRSR